MEEFNVKFESFRARYGSNVLGLSKHDYLEAMEDFQIMFELSEHQISQIYEVLGKEDNGNVKYEEVSKLLNTLVRNLLDDDCDDYSEDDVEDNSREEQFQQAKAALTIDTNRARTINSINQLCIGCDNFQDLKLILYSINFYGEDSITFNQLGKQLPNLITTNFTKQDLEAIFEILQDEEGRVRRADLDYFIQEAEQNRNNIRRNTLDESIQSQKQSFIEIETNSAGGRSMLSTESEGVLEEDFDKNIHIAHKINNTLTHQIDELRSLKNSKKGPLAEIIKILFKLNNQMEDVLTNLKVQHEEIMVGFDHIMEEKNDAVYKYEAIESRLMGEKRTTFEIASKYDISSTSNT